MCKGSYESGVWTLFRRFGLFAAGVVITLAVVAVAAAFAEPERPAILKDLPRTTEETAQSWNTRLQGAFPPGTSEAHLLAALSGWGFTIVEGDDGLYARFATRPIICQETFAATWATGDGGTISDLRGVYHSSCP